MSTTLEIFKETDFLSRLLTANPYTAEGKSILNGLNIKFTTDEFFEEDLYAKPFFIENQSDITNNTFVDDDVSAELSDNEDYIFVSDDHSLSINTMIKKYGNFQDSFNNLNEFPLLFIRGGSGTGKSTYMYELIHELTKSNPNVFHTELTLEKYTDKNSYYGIKMPEMSDETITRFIRIVFFKIFDIIHNLIVSQNFANINAFCECYHKTFMSCSGENSINMAIFKVLNNPEFQRLETSEYNKKVITEGIEILLNGSKSSILSNLLLLLIEVCYCLNPTKFNLISFDGIEYLINRTHHIYDADINDIILSFYNMKRAATDFFQECKLNFADNFKIVLAIRNTTIEYCNEREQEDIRDSKMSADVTDWYRLEDIYEKRIKYFTEKNYICEGDFEKIKDIVDIVIKDVQKGQKRARGAMDMLERMYNFDKRSLQSNLLSAVSQIVLGSEGGILKEKFIEFYNDKGTMPYNSNDQGYRFRYLCRRAIIRILLNRIDLESRGTFFDGIYFNEEGEESLPSSFMRKLLIFLMHNQVVDNKIKDNYVSLASVIDAVTRTKTNTNIQEKTLKQIARLIYKLSDYKLHDSAWQQLISIKCSYSDKQFLSDEKQFVAKIKDLYDNNNLSDEDFGIKLNYAGVFLAYIQSDFEFFACRCQNSRVPLIFSNDTKYIISLLGEVYLKAVNCIKMVIDNEKDIFGDYKKMYLSETKYLYKDIAYDPNGRLISHPKRIINNHIMYLVHYRCFVKGVNDLFSLDEKNLLVTKIDEYINKYKKIFNDLVDGYGSPDGDLAGLMYLKDYNEIPYLWKSSKI